MGNMDSGCEFKVVKWSTNELGIWHFIQNASGVFCFVFEFYLFIFGCAGSSLPGGLFTSSPVRGLLIAVVSCRAQALGLTGFSSSGAQARWLRHTGAVAPRHVGPGSGIKPMSPALADGFFSTQPPGQPLFRMFWWNSNSPAPPPSTHTPSGFMEKGTSPGLGSSQFRHVRSQPRSWGQPPRDAPTRHTVGRPLTPEQGNPPLPPHLCW